MKHTPMKRTISLLLAVLLVAGIVPVTALAEPVKGPQLAEGTHVLWSDRLADSDYDHFADWLDQYTYMLEEPSENTLLESGDYGYLLREYTGSVSFTYDPASADPNAAAQAAAEEAAAQAIASSGNDDLDTVNAYATAIYSTFLMDNLELYQLSGDLQVGEERSFELEYEAGEGTVTYTQRFYFYLYKADGSFDIRAEEYRSSDSYDAMNSALSSFALDLIYANSILNRTPYEALLALHQYLIEHNEYNTSADLTAISQDCRNVIGGMMGSTGTNGLVCEGYARTFMLYASVMGYPVTLVTGLANGEPHMWVNIQMGDGKWYAVDPTWNDPVGGDPGAVSGLENTKYFLVGSDTVIDGVPFGESHIVTNVLTEGGLAFTNGPELAKDSYTVQPGDIVSTTVYVNGKDVKEIDAADDTISWNEDTKTLTLNNANILAENGTYKGSGIYVVGGDTVVLELKGDNIVEGLYDGNGEIYASAAISAVFDLIIRGDGSLTATDLLSDHSAEISAGIFSGGNLTVEGGTIHASGQLRSPYGYACGLACGDYDSISTLSVVGGTVNATGRNYGALIYEDVNISGGVLNCVAQNDNGSAITLCAIQRALRQGRVTLTGGTLTAQSGRSAVDGFMSLSGYDFYRWKDSPDGELRYTSLMGIYGMAVPYLHIEPSPYVIAQPDEDNKFTTQAQDRTDGTWGPLPEDITADYQWYHVTNTPITDQNIVMAEEGAVYDAQSQLWNLPMYGMVALEAKAGDVITFTLHGQKPAVLYVTAWGQVIFDEVAPGVYSYKITEEVIDPDTGLFAVVFVCDITCRGTLVLSAEEQVQTDANIPNCFVSDIAGTYVGRVTLSKDGVPFAVLNTKNFDYAYIGWKIVYGEGGVVLGTQYLYLDEVQYTGWTEIEGQWYYLDPETGYRAEGEARLPYPNEKINGVTYAPDQESIDYAASKGQTFIDEATGRFLFDENGVFQSRLTGLTGDNRWVANGHIAWHVGLVQVGEDYYYFTGDTENGGNIMATGDVYVSRNTTDFDMVAGGVYTFGENGKLCKHNGITEVNGVLRYYEDARLMLGNGLTKVGEKYIYVNSKGELIVDAQYYIPGNDLGIASGMYYFDENGFMVEPVSTDKNGVYFENGAWYYYENGKIGYNKGLMAYGDGYIYVRSSGKLATGEYYITNVPAELSGLFRMGQKVVFDENGCANAPKQGIHEVDGQLYYFVFGQIQYNAGLIQVGDNWIYVRSNGALATGKYWITNTNGHLDQGMYEFGEDGYMVITDTEDGIVSEGENLYYYLDGRKQFGLGLVQLEDGSYIYVRTNGALAVGSYWVTNHNGLLPEGLYDFGVSGKTNL